jgi:hypothetical protein
MNDPTTDGTPNLNAAYGLATPEDNLALYREWAASYDQTFAAALTDLGVTPIDGTDFSPEMLGVATTKGIFDHLSPPTDATTGG